VLSYRVAHFLMATLSSFGGYFPLLNELLLIEFLVVNFKDLPNLSLKCCDQLLKKFKERTL